MLEAYRGKKVVLGISGGPDSVALFALAKEAGVKLIAAHVNYHHRASADRDQALVERLCQQAHVPCFVMDAIGPQGNFQAWARKVRYDFFADLARRCKADAIFVAHQRDDLIETYLFQKRRGSLPDWWGLQAIGHWQEIPVVRPLLAYRKQELIAFLNERKIAYGIDESNLGDDYERNRIRHAIVEKMSDEECRALCQTIEAKNRARQEKQSEMDAWLKTPLSVKRLFAYFDPNRLLRYWIVKESGIRLGEKTARDLLRQLRTEKNVEIVLKDCVKLSKMYDVLEIHKTTEVSYCYVLDKIEMLKTPYFKISPEGKGTEAVTLSADDFPITIRNAQKSDAIVLRFGTKKVFRWFIDRKIPREARKSWPVVVNCHGEIVLVPQIGCDVKHYSKHPTCFVVK